MDRQEIEGAIEAVLNPPRTDELYFVANGTGGHAFSATMAEHEKNVAHWRQVERQAKLEGRPSGGGSGAAPAMRGAQAHAR